MSLHQRLKLRVSLQTFDFSSMYTNLSQKDIAQHETKFLDWVQNELDTWNLDSKDSKSLYVGMHYSQSLATRVKQHILCILAPLRAHPNVPWDEILLIANMDTGLPMYKLARELKTFPLFYSVCLCHKITTRKQVEKLERFFTNQLRGSMNPFQTKNGAQCVRLPEVCRGLNTSRREVSPRTVCLRPLYRKLKALQQQPMPRAAAKLVPEVMKLITRGENGHEPRPYKHFRYSIFQPARGPRRRPRYRIYCVKGPPTPALKATLNTLGPAQCAALRGCILRTHYTRFRTDTAIASRPALQRLSYLLLRQLKAKQFTFGQKKLSKNKTHQPSPLVFRIDLTTPKLSHLTTAILKECVETAAKQANLLDPPDKEMLSTMVRYFRPVMPAASKLFSHSHMGRAKSPTKPECNCHLFLDRFKTKGGDEDNPGHLHVYTTHPDIILCKPVSGTSEAHDLLKAGASFRFDPTVSNDVVESVLMSNITSFISAAKREHRYYGFDEEVGDGSPTFPEALLKCILFKADMLTVLQGESETTPQMTPQSWASVRRLRRLLYVTDTEKDKGTLSYICPYVAHKLAIKELSKVQYTKIGVINSTATTEFLSKITNFMDLYPFFAEYQRSSTRARKNRIQVDDEIHGRTRPTQPETDKYAAPPPFRVASKVKLVPPPLPQNPTPQDVYNAPPLKRIYKIRPIIAGGHSTLSPIESVKVAVEKLLQPMREARWRDLFLNPQKYVKPGVTLTSHDKVFIASCYHPRWLLKNSTDSITVRWRNNHGSNANPTVALRH